ncbi:MAG: hypothetical protein ACR2MC_05375 [Actinomycetota bacterium]
MRPITAAIVCVLAGAVLVAWGPPSRSRIAFADGTPEDLQRLATATWGDFIAAFPRHRDCIDPVTVIPALRLGDRATYAQRHALVTVRVPGTAPNLRAALVHEFAHHLDYTCPSVRHFRRRFLAAQGLATTRPWFTGATWEQTPAEQFADAAVEIVLGRTSWLRLHAREAALQEMRAWGARE